MTFDWGGWCGREVALLQRTPEPDRNAVLNAAGFQLLTALADDDLPASMVKAYWRRLANVRLAGVIRRS